MNILEIKEQARIKDIKEKIENAYTEDKVWLWNEYCEHHNYLDDHIYTNDEDFFQCYYSGTSFMKLLEDTSNDYKTDDDYVVFTIYGLHSGDYIEDLVNFDIDELAEFSLEYCSGILNWDDNDEAVDEAILEALQVAMDELNVSFNLEDVFTYVMEYGDEEKTPLELVKDYIEDVCNND